MAEDRFTRKSHPDTRSECEKRGHDYREVNSTSRKVDDYEPVEEWNSFHEEFRPTGDRRPITRTWNEVTYRCSICGNTIERREDEREY